MTTIHNLRLKGCKVRVGHWRFVNGILYPPRLVGSVKRQKRFKEIKSKGGKTEIELTFPGIETFSSYAKCRVDDNFNRKIGINICLGRIRKKLEKLKREDLLTFFK